jgi:hypothetical protein
MLQGGGETMARDVKSVVFLVAIFLLLFIAMYYLREYFGFPPALFASCLLSLYLLYLMQSRWRQLKKIQKIALIWSFLGVLGLTIAFGIDYLITPVRVTFLHFVVAVLPPGLILAWKSNENKNRST